MTEHPKAENLQQIRGIGPNTSKELQKVGVTSLVNLSKQTPENLVNLLGLSSKKLTTVQVWIEEAQRLLSTQKKKSAIKLPLQKHSRERYATFTLEILLDPRNYVRRTQVVHVQSGDKSHWPAWDSARLVQYVVHKAKIKLPNGKEKNPATAGLKPGPAEKMAATQVSKESIEKRQISKPPQEHQRERISLSVTDIQVIPISLKIQMQCVVRLTGLNALDITSHGAAIVVEVLGYNLSTAEVSVIYCWNGTLETNQLEYPLTLHFPTPKIGRYRLEVVAFIPEEDASAVQLGPVLTAIP